MNSLYRTLATVAVAGLAALAVVGAYAEAHRAPDQP
jgi:hypothetical protein